MCALAQAELSPCLAHWINGSIVSLCFADTDSILIGQVRDSGRDRGRVTNTRVEGVERVLFMG